MKTTDVKKLYVIHSWVGLITGILLFVIAFTGAVSVFGRPEIKIWANPEIRQEAQIDTQKLEQVIAEQAATIDEAYYEEVFIFVPGARTVPVWTIWFENHDTHQAVLLKLDNETLEVISRQEGDVDEIFAGRKTDVADFIVDFHADLHLGRPVGLLLTGLLGLTLMASIVTGFIIHRQKLRQLFTFRFKKSLDISLADSHKLFGVWGLIFHGVIAFSGAFLGLATVILIPAAAFVSFGGDQEKLVETFNTAPEPVLAQELAPTRLAPALEHALNYRDDAVVEMVTIYGFNDKNALIYTNARGGDGVARQIMAYQGSTGEFNESFGQFSKLGGFSTVVLDLMFPLHFGNFGGAFVKWIWTILGLSTALLPLSGMMLWIERGQRAKSPRYTSATYERFNRLVIGTCGGMVLACAALFPTQLFLIANPTITATGFAIGCVFFSVWALSTVGAFLTRTAGQAARSISYASGTLLIASVFANPVLTGDNLIGMLINQQWVAGFTDVTLLICGVLICFGTYSVNAKNTAVVSQADQAMPEPKQESA